MATEGSADGIAFNWKLEPAYFGATDIENWFAADLWRHRRFVYNAFKRGVAIGVDLRRKQAQITWFKTGERRHVKFADVTDVDLGDALKAVADLPEIPDCDVVRHLISLLLQNLGFDITKDEISSGAMDDLKPEPKLLSST